MKNKKVSMNMGRSLERLNFIVSGGKGDFNISKLVQNPISTMKVNIEKIFFIMVQVFFVSSPTFYAKYQNLDSCL